MPQWVEPYVFANRSSQLIFPAWFGGLWCWAKSYAKIIYFQIRLIVWSGLTRNAPKKWKVVWKHVPT